MKKSNHHNYRFFFIILVLFYILVSLMNFYSSVNRRKEAMNLTALQDLAIQSAAILNEEIDHYFDFLQSLSYLSEGYDLDDPKLIKELDHFTIKSEFQRFGVADLEGNALVTNGNSVNVSDRDFINKSLEGDYVISDTLDSKLVDDKIIICSVPIRNRDNSIKGVLYGILEKEELELFHESVLENEYYYVHVIDSEGNYVYYSNHENKIITDENNFYNGFKDVEANYTLDEIKSRLEANTNILVEVSRGDEDRLIYFSKLDHSNWCAISVVDQAYVTESVDSLLSEDVFWLSVNLIGALVVLGIVIFYYQNKEKDTINKLNNKLIRNEEIYKAAAFSEDNIVFVYDVRKDVLEFISGNLKIFSLNEKIEKASSTILETFNYSGNVDQVISSMKKAVSEKETAFEDEIKVEVFGKKKYYHIYASSIFAIDGMIETIVGNMHDITDEKEDMKSLRQKAEIDALTGAYNREGGIRKIQKVLDKEGNHAFVLLDLDHFKELNDTLGHKYGDRALVEVTKILKTYFRKEDIVCRLGGDEFVVFIQNISKEVAVRILNTLLKRLNLTYEDTSQISASMGVAIIPQDGSSFEELYEKADKALYRAKSLGRNRCCLYEEDSLNEE